jgi:hypothetical protein
MDDFTEERLAELIALLAPAPQGWVTAAIELPRASAAIDELVVAATADAQRRSAIMADLEQALRGAGLEPRSGLTETLRARLSGLD